MGAPMFSIMVATLNVEATLQACLDSILRQTYADFELVIVDGCSTDGTLDIANGFASKFATRVVIDSARDQTVYAAWSRAVGLTPGQWLLHLGADDSLYEADTLARVATFIGEHEPVDLVY